jgi:hypothetical protein
MENLAGDIRIKTGRTMTLQEMAELQRVAGSHFSFSLTLECPLSCKHCLVNAGPSKSASILPLEMAKRFANQMNELQNKGIQAISFTGGEAILAEQQLQCLSKAAMDAGILTGIVTSSFWATSNSAAAEMIERFPDIAIWDISVDRFHSEVISMDYVKAAYHAVRAAGKVANIRFCSYPSADGLDSALLDLIYSFAEPDTIFTAKLRHTGRGTSLQRLPNQGAQLLMKPCFTQGPIIRPDGSVGPCCVTLAESRNHPFQFGNAFERPLVDIHEDFLCHPLLQLIRTIGFAELYTWMREANIYHHFTPPESDDICDVCPDIMTNSNLYKYLAERAATPENRLRIAVLASQFFFQNQMLHRTLAELECNKIPDYWETKKYAESLMEG